MELPIMAFYESTFIARQDLSRADVTRLIETFSTILTENGGKVIKTEYWGLRSLAYKINKNKKGHYAFLGIEAPATAINELNRNLGLNEEVVRTLTVRVDAIEEGQSAILSNRGDRNEEFVSESEDSAPAAAN
jgi:small subunit ribosomal protein S6